MVSPSSFCTPSPREDEACCPPDPPRHVYRHHSVSCDNQEHTIEAVNRDPSWISSPPGLDSYQHLSDNKDMSETSETSSNSSEWYSQRKPILPLSDSSES